MPDEIAASAGGCVVCGPSAPSTPYLLEESMFRTGEKFAYHRCSVCGSMQVEAVPTDLARFYDTATYSSFNVPEVLGPRWRGSRLVRIAWALRGRVHLATGRAGTGMTWLREVGARPSDRLLDLGCGDGHELMRLRKLGFRHLRGADPFLGALEKDVHGIQLVRAFHDQLRGSYDVVTLHHAFEHIPDPRSTLASLRRLIAPDGVVLIRMPVMGQVAWDEYGTDWAQLDPPRHLVIYSLRGARDLFEQEGFRVTKVFYDSHAYQFGWSELVRAGVPFGDGSAPPPTPGQLAMWEARAAELNAQGRGDQAGYVLRLAN